MKIKIREFWTVETEVPTPSSIIVPPEETLKNIGFITICEIIIDGQRKGEIKWNGKKLSIGKPSGPEGDKYRLP